MHRAVRSIVVAACVAASLAIAPGCATRSRGALTEAELAARRDEYVRTAARENYDDATLLLGRMRREVDDFAAGRSSAPPTLDILVVSGGGDYGAFGAGFLEGWGTVTDPQWKRPEFDVVTGVSTGALIAPFAFIGDHESYERVLRIYRAPKKDWFTIRGLLFFLPHNESFASIDGLRRDVRSEYDEEIVRKVAAGRREGRLIAIAATNLDYGMRRVWDLGRESERVLAGDDIARVHERLLASAAIPAVFPPVEIDGCLYVDGSVTSNILYNANMRSPASVVHRWKEAYPQTPMPAIRVWVIINGQLMPPPQVTAPTWIAVTAASTGAVVRSAMITALEQLATELALLEAVDGVRSEFYVVAIPDAWRPPKEGLFEPETMKALADLGRELGANPQSWHQGTVLPQQLVPSGVDDAAPIGAADPPVR